MRHQESGDEEGAVTVVEKVAVEPGGEAGHLRPGGVGWRAGELDEGAEELVHVLAVELGVDQVHVRAPQLPQAQEEVEGEGEASVALGRGDLRALSAYVHAVFA